MRPAGVAVELDGVCGHHPQTPDGPEIDALADVSLSLATGEMVAVVGPSGAGKSTLLHMMGGLAQPTSGTVSIASEELRQLKPRQLAEFRARTVGFVFQAFNLLAHLSVAQNVAVPATLLGRPRREVERRVGELLDLVGLADRATQRPARLSGGEQQRVALARALVNDPPLVLADEPTGNLDSTAGRQVMELLEACHSAGRTVVIATHDMRLASRAERIIHLRDGRLTHISQPRTEPARKTAVSEVLRLA